MEAMIVSSSVSRTSSLDGQMSHRYTSFPSEVVPVPPTRLSTLVPRLKRPLSDELSLLFKYLKFGSALCTVLTQRLLLKVNSDGAGEGISYHQGRGGQVVGMHTVAQATLEVPVSR